MVKIAIKEGDLKRAKEIGEKFQNNATIQSQMLKIAIKEGDLKRAKEIGERFPKDVPMQSQMLKIAIKEEDFARAKEIGDRFPNNETIQSQMLRIARMKKSEETMLEQNFENDESDKSKKILNRLKTQIYYDQIDNQLISDIESSEELSDFEKIVSILAICEKRNMKGKAKDVLKKFKLTDKKEKGIVQGIMDRIQSKKLHIFDISKYSPILQWSYDEELKTQYEDELGKERETNRELKKQSATICSQINTNPSTVKQPDGSTPNPPIPKSPIIGKKSDSGAEYRRSLVVRNIGDSKPEELPKEQKIKNQTQKKIDYIHKFVQEQRKLVYVKMQSQSPEVQADAINKWDRMEILLEKIAKRSTDTQYIENLYNRVLNLSKSNDKGMEY